MKYELMLYRQPNGQRKTAIVGTGHKHVHVVTMDGSLSVKKVKREELRFMEPMEYSPRRAAWLFRQYGKDHGMTESAAKLLKEFRKQNRKGENNEL